MTTAYTGQITPELQALLGAMNGDKRVLGIFGFEAGAGFSVEYEGGDTVLMTGLLRGHDIALLPEGRIQFVAPQQGQPFAWAYRLPSAVKWTITTTDPTTNHTAEWRTARIIQPLYMGPGQ